MDYRIAQVDDTIEVAAGRFTKVIRVEGSAQIRLHVDAVQGVRMVEIKHTEWYAPGVGLVKLLRDEALEASYISGGKMTLELLAVGGL
jgi:hypothetical protein